jgi:hypothetical protein
MEIQDWVSIATLLVMLTGFYAAIRRELGGLRAELKADVAELRTELKIDIAELRTDLKTDIGRLDDRVERLDDRVYALAVGLKPELEARRGESG